MTFEDIVRLVILAVASIGGIAAFAAWREARTTQKMLRTLIAHQFKTPLSAVLSALYTAHDRRHEMPEEALSELLETAIAEAHELDRLMSGFLSLTGAGDVPERGRFRRRSHRSRAPEGKPDGRHLRSLDS